MAMSKKKPKPKPTVLKGKAAIDAYKKSISHKGMAKAEAAAKKAIEDKYPGMFIPETKIPIRGRRDRFTPPGRRGR
jgi:hypothetical protein